MDNWKIALIFVMVFFFSLTFVSSVITTDLNHYYDFNESSGDLIDIINGKINGSLIEPPGYTFGQGVDGIVEYGYNFSALATGSAGTYIDITENIDDCSDLICSFSIWANFSATGNRYLFYLGNITKHQQQIALGTFNGKFHISFANETGDLRTLETTETYNNNLWQHLVVTFNGTHLTTYVNNTYTGNLKINTTSFNLVERVTYIGALAGNIGDTPDDRYRGRIDEFGIWNKSLTADEVSTLYNNGAGLSYPFSETGVTLNSPANESTHINSVLFNATLNPFSNDLQNATLYVWDSDGDIFNQTTNPVTGTSENETTWNVTNFIPDTYTWNVYGCSEDAVGDALCSWGNSNRTFYYGLSDIETNYTINVTETSYQYFNTTFNVASGTPTAGLWWNGTRYAGTLINIAGNNWRASTSFDIPNSGVKSLFWEINIGSLQYNTTAKSQTSDLLNMSICGTPYGTPFINFTFKDEADSTAMNAFVDSSTWTYWAGSGSVTKTTTYSSPTTANPSYAFCFTPNVTITTDLTLKYSNTSYPQRTYTFDDTELTNTSVTNTVLYLLGTSDGIYSTFQFLDASDNSPIEDVLVTIERQISSVWTTMGQGSTDGAGTVTFWVNPDYPHRISGTKSGYAGIQQTITPSQSTYTVFMGTSTNASYYQYRYKNILYSTYPMPGRLEPDTDYKFGFNITADDGNVVSCKLEIKNITLDVVASTTTGCTAYGGTLSVTYNTGNNQKLFGYYYVDLGNGLELFKANDAWFMEELEVSSGIGILNFLSELKELPDWGDNPNRSEFSRIVFCFFLMIILVGFFTFFTGYDIANPGAGLFIVFGFMLAFSIAGLMSIGGITPYSFFNQYWIVIVVGLLTFGFYLNYIRRTSN
jgi:hypothetical protein